MDTHNTQCDWCGQYGHDYNVHSEARYEAAAWSRAVAREEFPFGDHK